jgi:DnaJ-class molecular chaperone
MSVKLEIDYKDGYVYQQNCYQIFDEYFLKHNPFYDICDLKGEEHLGSLFGTAYGGANEPSEDAVGDVVVDIPCTLQEFYNGCIKTISYQRQQLALDGHTTKLQTQSKDIIVKPGFSPNNHFIYKGEGHQTRKLKTDLVVKF